MLRRIGEGTTIATADIPGPAFPMRKRREPHTQAYNIFCGVSITRHFKSWSLFGIILGLLSDQRRDRRKTFHTHVLDLCKRILDDEKALMARIKAKIVTNTGNIIKISKELLLTVEVEDVDNLALLDPDALLQERVDELEQIKKERIENLRELQEKDEKTF